MTDILPNSSGTTALCCNNEATMVAMPETILHYYHQGACSQYTRAASAAVATGRQNDSPAKDRTSPKLSPRRSRVEPKPCNRICKCAGKTMSSSKEYRWQLWVKAWSPVCHGFRCTAWLISQKKPMDNSSCDGQGESVLVACARDRANLSANAQFNRSRCRSERCWALPLDVQGLKPALQPHLSRNRAECERQASPRTPLTVSLKLLLMS